MKALHLNTEQDKITSMASFITRVELHQAKSSDYDELHEGMEDRGFSRLITSDKGVTYHLPTAEYDYIGNKTRQQVLELAKAAAAATGKKASIMVTESKGSTWHNLPEED